jgi:tetratricopeptide (TPR) repeat protein
MLQHLEYIDAYFQAPVKEEMATEFSELIQKDEFFAQQVAFYLSSMSALREHNTETVKMRFRELYENTKMQVADRLAPRKTPATQLRVYLAAACAIGLIILSVFVFTEKSSPRQIASTYINTELSKLGVPMGTTEDSLELGKQLHDDGKYEEALTIFESIRKSDPNNVLASEYAGVAALQLNDYNTALRYFIELSHSEGLISNPGNFYSAITLMKRDLPGDKERAKELLELVVKEKSAHSEIAESWLKNW